MWLSGAVLRTRSGLLLQLRDGAQHLHWLIPTYSLTASTSSRRPLQVRTAFTVISSGTLLPSLRTAVIGHGELLRV